MGSKSGPSSNQSGFQATTSTYSPNPEAMAAYREALNMAYNVSHIPYEPYQGQRVAGFTEDQLAAMQGIREAQGQAQPYIDAATRAAQMGLQYADPSRFSQESLKQYYNPYQQNVINATMANIDQMNRQQQNELTNKIVSSGAMGGDRAGIARAELSRQQNLVNQQTMAQLQAQGYGQAVNQYNQQQQTAIGAAQQGAYSLGQLGLQSQQAAYQGLQALMGSGAMQQQLGQQQLDAEYQAWQMARAYPYQQAAFYAGIAGGIAPNMGGTTNTMGFGQSNQQQSGGGSGASQGMGMLTSMLGLLGMSDERTKTNVDYIGRDEETGLPLVTYDDKGDVARAKRTGELLPPKRISVMAQDVEEAYPEAVTDLGGLKAIDRRLLRADGGATDYSDPYASITQLPSNIPQGFESVITPAMAHQLRQSSWVSSNKDQDVNPYYDQTYVTPSQFTQEEPQMRAKGGGVDDLWTQLPYGEPNPISKPNFFLGTPRPHEPKAPDLGYIPSLPGGAKGGGGGGEGGGGGGMGDIGKQISKITKGMGKSPAAAPAPAAEAPVPAAPEAAAPAPVAPAGDMGGFQMPDVMGGLGGLFGGIGFKEGGRVGYADGGGSAGAPGGGTAGGLGGISSDDSSGNGLGAAPGASYRGMLGRALDWASGAGEPVSPEKMGLGSIAKEGPIYSQRESLPSPWLIENKGKENPSMVPLMMMGAGGKFGTLGALATIAGQQREGAAAGDRAALSSQRESMLAQPRSPIGRFYDLYTPGGRPPRVGTSGLFPMQAKGNYYMPLYKDGGVVREGLRRGGVHNRVRGMWGAGASQDPEVVATQTIAAEERTPEGREAVANVILNRLMSQKYGQGAREVALAPRQFEPWSPAHRGGPNDPRKYTPGSPEYEAANQALKTAMTGERDVSGGATHFMNPDIVASRYGKLRSWEREGVRHPTAVIGEHVFYAPGANAPGMVAKDALGYTAPEPPRRPDFPSMKMDGANVTGAEYGRSPQDIIQMRREAEQAAAAQRNATADMISRGQWTAPVEPRMGAMQGPVEMPVSDMGQPFLSQRQIGAPILATDKGFEPIVVAQEQAAPDPLNRKPWPAPDTEPVYSPKVERTAERSFPARGPRVIPGEVPYHAGMADVAPRFEHAAPKPGLNVAHAAPVHHRAEPERGLGEATDWRQQEPWKSDPIGGFLDQLSGGEPAQVASAETPDIDLGGLLGFADGGGVEEYDTDKARALMERIGASPREAAELASVVMPESSGNPYALNPRGRDESYGLWQINMKGDMGPERRAQWGLKGNEELYNPETNARAALDLYRHGGMGHWSTYKSGANRPYLAYAADEDSGLGAINSHVRDDRMQASYPQGEALAYAEGEPSARPIRPTPQAQRGFDILGSISPEFAKSEMNPHNWSPEVSQALLAAGLGMMAGQSRNPFINIGQGGLAGLEVYQAAKHQRMQEEAAAAKQELEAQKEQQKRDFIRRVMSTEPPKVSSVPSRAPGAGAGAAPAVVASDALEAEYDRLANLLPAAPDDDTRQVLTARMHALETQMGRREKKAAAAEKQAKEAQEAAEKTPGKVFEKKHAEVSASEFAKNYQETQAAAQSAQKSDAILKSTLEALNDPEVYTGIRGDTVLDVKKGISQFKEQFPTLGSVIPEMFTPSKEGIAKTELLKSGAIKSVLEAAGGRFGAGFSDGDRKAMEAASFGVGTSREGNIKIVKQAQAANQRIQKIAEMQNQYLEKHGVIDAGFNRELEQYAKAHPLFDAQGNPLGAGGEKRTVLKRGKEKGTGRAVIQYSDGTTEYAD